MLDAGCKNKNRPGPTLVQPPCSGAALVVISETLVNGVGFGWGSMTARKGRPLGNFGDAGGPVTGGFLGAVGPELGRTGVPGSRRSLDRPCPQNSPRCGRSLPSLTRTQT